MAITYALQSPFTDIAGNQMLHLWINQYPVGPDVNQSYDSTDVLLIQYMLWRLFQGDNPLNKPGAPTAALARDGIFGPITESFILFFQQSDASNTMLVDGRVDYPASLDNDGGIMTSNSHTIYTILRMNAVFSAHYPATFSDLSFSTDPDFPVALKNALQNTNQSQ